MIKLKLYSLLAGLLLLVSCDKELDVSETPDFEVSTAAASYKVGEAVKFSFNGSADLISFYSGQPLNDYTFKDGRVIDVAKAQTTLSFSSAVTGGSQKDQLSVLYSTNFNGNYDNLASVKAATWIDITDKFKWGTGEAFLASGPLNISELLVAGKPIYFAFKYVTKPQAQNGLARTWMIQNFTLRSDLTLGANQVTITDQLNAGFRIVDEHKENAPARSVVTSARLSLLGNLYKDPADPLFDPKNPIYDPQSPTYDATKKYVPYDPNSPYNDLAGENWAISKPILVDKVDLGPDRAIAIKGMDTETKEYTFTYNTPGTYQAHFVANNNTIHESKTVVKAVELNIAP